MVSVTLDSNIYISALNYGGVPLRLLNLARDGEVRLDVSDAILDEVAEVLRDKFRWRDADIEMVKREIRSFANHVTPGSELHVVAADDDDNRILECAETAGSDYVITGDKHLLRLSSYENARIITPAEFWSDWENRSTLGL